MSPSTLYKHTLLSHHSTAIQSQAIPTVDCSHTMDSPMCPSFSNYLESLNKANSTENVKADANLDECTDIYHGSSTPHSAVIGASWNDDLDKKPVLRRCSRGHAQSFASPVWEPCSPAYSTSYSLAVDTRNFAAAVSPPSHSPDGHDFWSSESTQVDSAMPEDHDLDLDIEKILQSYNASPLACDQPHHIQSPATTPHHQPASTQSNVSLDYHPQEHMHKQYQSSIQHPTQPYINNATTPSPSNREFSTDPHLLRDVEASLAKLRALKTSVANAYNGIRKSKTRIRVLEEAVRRRIERRQSVMQIELDRLYREIKSLGQIHECLDEIAETVGDEGE